MPQLQDQYIAAIHGTSLLRFRFFGATKATDDLIKTHTLKRLVIAYRIIDGRPMPVTLALPVDEPENFDGVEVISVPNVGIFDPLTGESFKDIQAWIDSTKVRWAAWLKSNSALAATPPVRTGSITLGNTRATIGGFIPVDAFGR